MKILIHDNFEVWGGDHSVDFANGTTVLVGPNGSGKTSTLISVREYCNQNNIHHLDFNNLSDGGNMYADKLLNTESDMAKTATYICSSEGQRIIQAFSDFASKIGKGVRDACADEDCKVLVITLDALDSGLSINNIRQIKQLFRLIENDCEASNVEVHIIVAANSFEFARKETCIDVTTGEPIWFEDYENYANFICKEDYYG